MSFKLQRITQINTQEFSTVNLLYLVKGHSLEEQQAWDWVVERQVNSLFFCKLMTILCSPSFNVIDSVIRITTKI